MRNSGIRRIRIDLSPDTINRSMEKVANALYVVKRVRMAVDARAADQPVDVFVHQLVQEKLHEYFERLYATDYGMDATKLRPVMIPFHGRVNIYTLPKFAGLEIAPITCDIKPNQMWAFWLRDFHIGQWQAEPLTPDAHYVFDLS